jgi:hypothetical protein
VFLAAAKKRRYSQNRGSVQGTSTGSVPRVVTRVYSTSRYNELRKWFTLPSTRSIRTELEKFSWDPGLLTDAFEHIKIEVSAGTLEPDCTSMVDEMAIMQRACWDPAKKKTTNK